MIKTKLISLAECKEVMHRVGYTWHDRQSNLGTPRMVVYVFNHLNESYQSRFTLRELRNRVRSILKYQPNLLKWSSQ